MGGRAVYILAGGGSQVTSSIHWQWDELPVEINSFADGRTDISRILQPLGLIENYKTTKSQFAIFCYWIMPEWAQYGHHSKIGIKDVGTFWKYGLLLYSCVRYAGLIQLYFICWRGTPAQSSPYLCPVLSTTFLLNYLIGGDGGGAQRIPNDLFFQFLSRVFFRLLFSSRQDPAGDENIIAILNFNLFTDRNAMHPYISTNKE